ncbi:terpenoid synthase [Hypomontagnella monticulosa]|nr:terpenoid synthase [Hypomontagnella monticulosa]
MSPSASETITLPEYQNPLKATARSSTPPPAPKDSQVPKGLRPTILEARKHPRAYEVVQEVNEFFLKNWPFRTEKHKKRFVDEGYAWFVCINCPLSLDDRMHWGCRLLTTGFLIDDLLDRMSVVEGVEHNSKVIECARGKLMPDRNIPAQWIMYDLFEDMRAIDKHLADELLEPTIDFLIAQADGNRMKPMSLKEYFEYRDADLGKGLLSGIMRFCAGLYMTPEELELVKPVEENSMKHITFVNDVCSFEKEVLAAKDGFELGAICSSVPIVMDLCGVNEDEAKRIMWEMVRAWEVKHFELVDEILQSHPSPALEMYLKGLEHQTAGNELWSLLTPRYNRSGGLAFTEGR